MHNKTTALIFLALMLASRYLFAAEENACPADQLSSNHDEESAPMPTQKVLSQAILFHNLLDTCATRIKIDFPARSIAIKHFAAPRLAGEVVINNVGAELLLWTVKRKLIDALEWLIEQPNDLANLSVVDEDGNNALKLAEDYFSTLSKDHHNHERWQNVMTKLRTIFQELSFTINTNTESPNCAWNNADNNDWDTVIAKESMYHFFEINGLTKSWQWICNNSDRE